jgi:hypothetical protein
MKHVIALLAMAALAAPAVAEMYSVEVTGTVEFNQVSFGQFASVVTGDPVTVSFMVDSENYLDSPNYPTRGYVVSDFWFTVGGVTVGSPAPYPGGATPYFVIRDNDPAVDGFFFSSNTDFPGVILVDEPAQLDDYFGVAFSATYGGDTLPSLDIADAVGLYDYDGLSVFNFALIDGPFEAMYFNYTQMVISGGGVATENHPLSQVKDLFR